MKLKLINNEEIEVKFWDFAIKSFVANAVISLIINAVFLIIFFLIGSFLII